MCLLDLGISALTSGITNTLTIGSGRGEIFGAWKGLGIEQQGHNLGHMEQPDNPIWIKIRQYNSRMLVRIMEALESVPEGSGTMMDNTLIVYTSNNADKQHTNGATWPVMLLGNCGGIFKTGCFTQLDGKRPINALYTTLLRAAGQNVDRFNMTDNWPESSTSAPDRSRKCWHDATAMHASVVGAGLGLLGLATAAGGRDLHARTKVDKDFDSFARPFLVSHCVDCHGEDGSRRQSFAPRPGPGG